MTPTTWSEEEFLDELYAAGGNITRAAKAVNQRASVILAHRDHNEDFDALVMDTVDRARKDRAPLLSHDPMRIADGRAKRKKARENRRRASTRDWKPVFLKNLRDNGGCITYAAQDAGVTRTAVYTARQRDEDFALAMHDAMDIAYESLVKEAHRRALGGSDLLIIFLMKGLHPEIWRDNYKLPSSIELDEQQLASMTSAIQNAMVEASMTDEQKRAFRESLEDRLREMEGANG